MTISVPRLGKGVKESLYLDYDFSDQPWYGKVDPDALKRGFLATKCVRVGSRYYVWQPGLGAWGSMPDRAAALATLSQQYMGTHPIHGQQIFITWDDLKAFLASGIVTFANTTYAPGASHHIIFDGERRLNTYRDTRMAGDDDHIGFTEELLKILRNALCDEPLELTLDAMLDEIMSKQQTTFRWMMHWLAALYQRPGYTPGTNLWLVGSLGGVGKGTLISALRLILGAAAVGKADQGDITKRGWTDSIAGKLLVEWDEFKMPTGWHEFNNFLKRWTGNERIILTSRGLTPVEHPAVAYHIFTTNDPHPVMVEEHDRRNTFIQTTMNFSWAKRASALWDIDSGEFADPCMVSGFAALLNAIEVDYRFIMKPIETEKRLKLKLVSEDTVKQWVREGALSRWPNKQATNWSVLHDDYKTFAEERTNMKPHDLSTFKARMEEFGFAKTTVIKEINPITKERKSVKVVKLAPPADVADDDVAGMAEEPKLVPMDFCLPGKAVR